MPEDVAKGPAVAPFPARRLAGILLDAILPPLCLSCGGRIASLDSLCPACWSRLTFVDEPRCDVWGEPFAFDAGGGTLSARAIGDPPPWSRLRAAVLFDDASARIVHALKYNDRHETRGLMSRLMHRAARDVLSAPGVIVPLPLHWLRLWRRRYNQSAILAQGLSRLAGLPARPQLLRRVRSTKRQVGLDHSARRKNVRGAFEVPAMARHDVSGRRIILVDDVVTTGATARAASEALLDAGAGAVDVVAFALVSRPFSPGVET